MVSETILNFLSGLTVQTVCSVLSIFISAIAAYFAYQTAKISYKKMTADQKSAVDAICHAEEQAKKRAMIDLLIAQKSDERYIEDSKLVRNLKSNRDICIASLVKGSSKEKDAILSVLNQLEFIAVGIRLGVFDEVIYKELSCSSVINVWNSASGFVYELRRSTDIPTLFQDLEHLANKWHADPIKEIKVQHYSK